ncbi:MAG: right-handed parallel beta-helix repeat-containing protein [Methanobacteriaceae archaeon]|jgi:lipopolysaccharide export LptBFGC system permease protein LptF|nr:right-handed parallel beta-helix repeat-containing protein [Methanobacteriaceae archaeon]
MNIKKITLPLLILFILATSISMVAAENVAVDNIATEYDSIEEVEEVNNVESASYADSSSNYIDMDEYKIVNENPAVITAQNSENIHNVNDTYTNSEIQTVINNAASGDTISFAEGNYNNISLSVDKTLKFVGAGINKTNLYSTSADDADMFNVKTSIDSIDGTSFKGMSFHIMASTDWNGRGIYIEGGKDIVVDSCAFINGNAGVYLRSNKGNTLVTNCFFTGDTNRSTIHTTNEVGTKAVNIMGGDGIRVTNNTFMGSVLDGVSIASNSKNVYVGENKFIDNIYGIFFGGGLVNISVDKNLFENIEVYAVGLAKAASYSKVTNNTFILANKSIAVYLEQGNTAHGAPTNIKEVYINGNSFKAASNANPFSINAVYVKSQNGPLQVQGALEVRKNTLDGGIKLFEFFNDGWLDGDDIVIKPETLNSTISGKNVTIISSVGNRFEVVVKDQNGKVVVGENVTFEINGVKYNRTSDENGVAGLNINLNTGNYTITAAYGGTQYLNPSKETYTITTVPGMTQLIGENANFTEKGSKYTTKLVDARGNALPGEVVSITINGLTYYKTTDENGIASLNINLIKGIYSIYNNFSGTYQYAATTGGNRITTNW